MHQESVASVLPFCSSTHAPADLLDDLHVRLQSGRWIFAPLCDTAFRPDRGIEWPVPQLAVFSESATNGYGHGLTGCKTDCGDPQTTDTTGVKTDSIRNVCLESG